MYLTAKVRGRGRPEGEEGLPYKLVKRCPQRGLKYVWVSEEHKKEMRKLASEMNDIERGILYSAFFTITRLMISTEKMHSHRARRLREVREVAMGRENPSSISDESESSTAGSRTLYY
ncbi:hypothetical protein CJF30_00010828 [Rutstroemia sp. NJR-2017a BBW]|nr:hypothetical protein CJF30_00010828 [Rutstroemia sp. NJR-2017a BBW]